MINEAAFPSRLPSALVCALLLQTSLTAAWTSQPKMAPAIVPDEKIQATIRRVVYAKNKEAPDRDDSEALKTLKEMSGKAPDVLGPQLIYYSAHAKKEVEAVGMIAVMGYFTAYRGAEIRQALIPLLETKDETLHHEVTTWLANIDGTVRPVPIENLNHYRKKLFQEKDEPPRGLVSYVFDVNAGQAMLLFGELYSANARPQMIGPWPRDLLWSDHVIQTVKWRLVNRFLQDGDLEKAQKELNTLSKHDGWYARRYVVEVMRELPKFGTPEIANRLNEDPHPLVREAAKLIK